METIHSLVTIYMGDGKTLHNVDEGTGFFVLERLSG